MKELSARFWNIRAKAALVFAALALLLPAPSAHADSPDFRCRPLLAGKASLTEPGFLVRRELGVASLALELRIPVELVYESSSASSGAFGFGWRSPQLESSVLREGRPHTEPRRHGGDVGSWGDVLAGAMRGDVTWG